MVKLVFVIIAACLYFLIAYLRKKRISKKKYGLPDEIKSRYRKISVPAGKMEILTNEYYEEDLESGYDKVKVIDALYDNSRNYSQLHKFASVIVYNDYMVMGKKYRLRSGTIDLGPDVIDEKLRNKGMIDIYFDEKNPGNHYFDLSFITD